VLIFKLVIMKYMNYSKVLGVELIILKMVKKIATEI